MPTDSFAASAAAPVAVKEVEISLKVREGTPNIYSGRYVFDRLATDGAIVDVRAGDIVPHLTPAQITSIKAFLDAMLIKAKSTIP